MVVNRLISNLAELGFTEYEAKAYIALAGNNPVTAYELSKISGIPSSKIYEVLSKLADKEAVLVLDHQDKKRYVPVNAQEYIDEQKSKLDTTIKELREDFRNISGKSKISYIWNLHDYDHLMNKAERMIWKSGKTLLISAWHQEAFSLLKILKEKEKKGINISIVHFGNVKISVGQIFQHPIEDTIYSEKGGRGFAVVADSRSALMGTVFEDNAVEGAWSTNNGFVTLAEDYIKHDIYIMKIVKRFDKLLIKRFGPNYEKLRNVYNDEEER
jgi:sugar-specific transcriptional regulator TrmB